MGIMQGLFGNASEGNIAKAKEEYQPFLVEDEVIIKVYKLIRDKIVFTDRRIIHEDVQGLSGTKVSFLSIPYRNISCFKKESAGLLDLNAELILSIKGTASDVRFTFTPDTDVNEVYMLISKYVLYDHNYELYKNTIKEKQQKQFNENSEEEKRITEAKIKQERERVIEKVGSVQIIEDLLKDEQINTEANELKRIYGQEVYESFLRDKAIELGLLKN